MKRIPFARPSTIAFCVSMLAAQRTEAAATFVIEVADPPGVGFDDPTPASPVGGNTGTTLGEQRTIALQYVLDRWSEAIDSTVPIRVSASFSLDGCVNGALTILGFGFPSGAELDVPNTPQSIAYPEALADRIAGFDMSPGSPDLDIQFHGKVAECLANGTDWYYGLDGNPGTDYEFVSLALHEIAHGLGFDSFINAETGESSAANATDPYVRHILDVETGKHWHEMTAAERAASAQHVRKLVWDGQFVTDAAATVLDVGSPAIQLTPVVAGFSGALSEANFGPRLSAGAVSGGLGVASPADGCTRPLADLTGKVALIAVGGCNALNKADNAQRAGAVAALMIRAELPPNSVEVLQQYIPSFSISIPVLGVSAADAQLLTAAGTPINVALSAISTRLVGADDQGRVFLYANSPSSDGTTFVHWDPLVRPDLVQEPVFVGNPRHDLTMERALLLDIGWGVEPGGAGGASGTGGGTSGTGGAGGSSGASGAGASSGAGGSSIGGMTASSSGSVAGTGGATTTGSAAAGGSPGPSSADSSPSGGSGCSCRVTATRTRSPMAALFALVAFALIRRKAERARS